ncbi:Rho1 guanine nucleotide exchange factor 3 [Wickerhamomyces ciferrii]|uniref:Rho1 guanine nucleotide exchange factor 3 n=1 Tax=Wickerhamomyces ciferrii (strain ATCC 14091 / BCRC 22168 / CBS 111 / JCM 3599 / NBRC 0793 / NRRL Y-1031 F-60-10) TaxID=1206466 RepID=K0KKM4_WICCF|nr:Rho1 guanine nucleotide exchange factor 3 [Wickerhamomyces ciferrii]CCH45745.1 Rho1 guanine nucleotide exchange factor 3 [Wickerhamomyces ciferrii]
MDQSSYNHQRTPYPNTELQWDPLESLQEFNKSTYSNYIQNLNLDSLNLQQQPIQQNGTHGPPLPNRPPQHIIDQHINHINQSSRYQSPMYQSQQQDLYQSSPSPSRVKGPRELPNKFSNSNLNSFINTTPTRQYVNSSIPNSINNSPLQYNQNYNNSSPQPYQFNSPSTIPKTSFPTSPSIQQSPPKPLKINTNYTQDFNQDFNPFDDSNKLSSAISSTQDLPDTPSLTPSSALRESISFTNSRKDPSPTRSILRGPRSMPNNSSNNSSPTKIDYYDHRTSWNSEYSINVLPADEIDDHQSININNELNEDEYEREYEPQPQPQPQPQQIKEIIPPIPRTKSLFNPREIEIPSSPPPRSNTINTISANKNLPNLPTNLNLPSLPFSSVSLDDEHFSQCGDIQYLSEIFKWCKKLIEIWSEGSLISLIEFKKCLKSLIQWKTKLNSYIIDHNIDSIISSLERQNSIYFDDYQNVFLMDNIKVNGVLPQLTGCYSKHTPEQETGYQCYSSRCFYTIYKNQVPLVPSKESNQSTLGEWTVYWNLTLQELKEIDEMEVKKQSHIFELIRQQQNIIKLGEIQIKQYGDSFKSHKPQLLPNITKFYNDAFNSVKPLIEIHKKHLLEPLLNKLNSQGKFINNIGEIFLNWTQLATVPYLKYTEKLATVRELIKFEKKNNTQFAKWLYSIDSNPIVSQASLDHNRIFFSGFIGHTQLLSLALNSVWKKTKTSEFDYKILQNAIGEINKLNRKIDEMQDSALQNRHLKLLSNRLTWKTNVLINELRLNEPNRRLIKEGHVMRKREKWITSTYYLILIDNYLLITEPQKDETFKISEKPIPIEFLQIETKNFLPPTTPNEQEGESYPFKIRYTGQNLSYTFFTNTLIERDNWFNAINQVQFKKVKNSNFEPFKISIITDQFAYEDGEEPKKLPVLGEGSNVEISLKSFEQEKVNLNLPKISRTLMMSEVLSFTEFQYQDKKFYALGLNFGLYITEVDDLLNWIRVLELTKITQLEQLDSLLILISDKALYSFNLVGLLINYYNQNYDSKIIGEKLSKKDVLKFKIGIYNNTKILFILKASITYSGTKFKVLTPIFNNWGEFQYFQIYKKFQYDYECFGISIFNSMFILHTSKGFEILSFQILNESQPIPKFIESMKKPKTEIELIKKKLSSTTSSNLTSLSSSIKPLSMIKVFAKPQFYLIYDSFVIVIDTIGQLISDNFIFPFKFKCDKISIVQNFLICIGDDIIEIFDLNYDDVKGFTKFDPVQIIKGKDIKLIDEDYCKIVMAHPSVQRRQLIFSLDLIV